MRVQRIRQAHRLVQLRAKLQARNYFGRETQQHTARSRGFHTTTTTTTASAQPPNVVSRRVWEAHQRRHAPNQSSSSSSSSTKQDEKPWPRSMQIAGYTMAALGIPYSIAWFASSNTQTRSILSFVIPNLDDMLRHHFGHEEPNSVSYCDRQATEAPQYQLEEEPTYRERLQQQIVESLNALDVKVRVQVRDREDGEQQSIEAAVPGTVGATPTELLHAVGYKNAERDVHVSVDFADLEENETGTFIDMEDDAVLLPDEHPSSDLLRETTTYSAWHYVAAGNEQGATQTSSSGASAELDISRLKYEIEGLERDLQDVNCTRDRDDMEQELKDKKRALRSLKWRRRLRWS